MEKIIESCLYFSPSKWKSLSEGAAKILKNLSHKWNNKIKSYLNVFFHLNRDEEAELEFLFLLILVFRIMLSPVIKSDLLLINPV